MKFYSWLVLVVLLAAMTHAVCDNAHAALGESSVTGKHAAQSEIFASDQCPCCPTEHQADHDVCDSCINCICHATSITQPFQLTYSPFFLDLQSYNPHRQLPEVYLSKFIPPQNRA